MRIIFVCPKPLLPSGGVSFIFQIVGLLNELGKESYVYTPEPFSPYWMAKPIDDKYILTEYKHNEEDTVIVPEVLWTKADFELGHTCFVQNTLWISKLEPTTKVLVVSRYLANAVKRLYSITDVKKITPYLEDNVWFSSDKTKDRVLVYARRNDHWKTMEKMLSESGFIIDLITEPLNQVDIAKHLSVADYYVHLSYPEGFVAAAMEAMRSKAIVVGTTGGGGNELMHHNETAFVVQDPQNGHYDNKDHEFQRRILDGLLWLRYNITETERIRETAYNWSRRYTAKQTKKELENIFGLNQ